METMSTGALASPFDVRTFTYDLAKDDIEIVPYEIGERWSIEHENQFKQGICTSEAIVGRAEEHYNKNGHEKVQFSDDFQYLLQKRFIDKNWSEGSSAFAALKAAHTYGLLREEHWTHTTTSDKKNLSYFEYSYKLKNVPASEVDRLIAIALSEGYKPKAYAQCKNVSRDTLASAIQSSGSLICRFVIGSEWYREPIEPLRSPSDKQRASGHLVNISKITGKSYRMENSWGDLWGDKGSAYGFLGGTAGEPTHTPTEAWQVWFDDVPQQIQEQIDRKEKLIGQILDLVQKLITLITKK